MSDDKTPRPAPTRKSVEPPRRGNLDLNNIHPNQQLTLSEFIRYIRTTDVDMTPEECQAAFEEIDTNRDGRIDLAQFHAWWHERLVPPAAQ